VISVYAPDEPAVPAVVTPVVYSDPPEVCVPSIVLLKRSGCVLLLLSICRKR